VSNHKKQRISGEIAASRASRDEPVERYLGIVIPIARSFQKRLPSSMDFDDLVGAGNLGLVEAARRFDSAEGISFTTFAQHRIRGAIMDSLRKIDPVSRCLRSQQKAAERATTELTTNLGRYPTETETAERLRLSLRRWRRLSCELYEAGCPVNGFPMKGPVAAAEADQLPGNFADPERLTALSETRSILGSAIGKLPTRYRKVLRFYHFEEWTMKQIGNALRIDESRVSQIRADALRRLRRQLAPVFRYPT